MRELEWVKNNRWWTAIGHRGTHWEIHESGGQFWIHVEHWNTPDWVADSLSEAQQLVAEIDARPPIPLEEQIPEQSPVAEIEGDQFAAFGDEPPPAAWSDCHSCGSSSRPERVKPIRHTPQWWMDPQPTWRCPDCQTERAIDAP